jgi:ribosomal protein S18 acetylase RimI-like enzyme
MKPIEIRPLLASEWQVLKDLRIRALTDAPDAFGPTAQDAGSQPDDYWQRGAQRSAKGDQRLFIACSGEDPVGLVSAVRDPEAAGHIGAMWVDPRARGSGLGRRLLEVACDWLGKRGCARLVLSVTDGNARAESLYASVGFERTGETEPLRAGSSLRNAKMEKRLTAG